MPVVLALTSALVYGVADYCGGRAARGHPSAIVAALGQAFSLILIVGVVLTIGTAIPPADDWAWGGLAGAAGALGLACFYAALGGGSMSVVAPTTAVVGVVIPVAAGLLQGERPRLIGYFGIAVGVACVALISGLVGERHHHTPRRILVLAVLAGVGFGSLFVLLARTSQASGLWPLVAARVVSVPLLLAIVVSTSAKVGPDRRLLRFARVAGVLDNLANLTYLYAVRGGLLSLVAVISSLYPASTVALAYVVDGERVSATQRLGMVLAAAALVLVTLGRT